MGNQRHSYYTGKVAPSSLAQQQSEARLARAVASEDIAQMLRQHLAAHPLACALTLSRSDVELLIGQPVLLDCDLPNGDDLARASAYGRVHGFPPGEWTAAQYAEVIVDGTWDQVTAYDRDVAQQLELSDVRLREIALAVYRLRHRPGSP